MAGKLEWHGDRIIAMIQAEITRRIKACCILVMNRAKVLLSVAGTMGAKDVEERAAKDATFAKQFNRNRATTSIKGISHHARLKRGKLVYKRVKGED
jgi:hypothetical protein